MYKRPVEETINIAVQRIVGLARIAMLEEPPEFIRDQSRANSAQPLVKQIITVCIVARELAHALDALMFRLAAVSDVDAARAELLYAIELFDHNALVRVCNDVGSWTSRKEEPVLLSILGDVLHARADLLAQSR